jgi:hypothetical protein
MSKLAGRAAAGAAGLLLLAAALAGCAGDGGPTQAEATPRQVEPSLEAQTVAFLEREGTALRRNLRRFLGPRLTTEVERGSAICRPARETPSIADPRRYPFACIVRATADGDGLEVEIVLGFVGTELEGRCWRAANERVAVTTSLPELLSRREARLPVNQIAACV